MKKFISVSLSFVSFPYLSRIWGFLTKLKKPSFLISRVIRFFKKYYKIDMDRYEGEVGDYRSLCDFFIRKLDSTKCPLQRVENYFLSPCDGVVTELEKIDRDVVTQVKGKSYSLTKFLKDDVDFSSPWHLMTIYLSPSDYHRFHTPVDMRVASFYHTGRRLFPVNRLSVNNIDDLFVKNERVVVKANAGEHTFYYAAVGATFVGSMKMVFGDDLPFDRWTEVDKDYRQNDEFGRFEMGSTIVLAVPDAMVDEMKVKKGERVTTGDRLFTTLSKR